MPVTDTPQSASEARLGIFWLLTDGSGSTVVADSVLLGDAEPYGDCLTYRHGHHEVWTRWQRLGARGLTARGLPPAVMSHEYDAVPRGRIVYECPAQRFVIYADRKLVAAPVVARIVHRFGLPQEAWEVRPDAHYRT